MNPQALQTIAPLLLMNRNNGQDRRGTNIAAVAGQACTALGGIGLGLAGVLPLAMAGAEIPATGSVTVADFNALRKGVVWGGVAGTVGGALTMLGGAVAAIGSTR